MNLAPYDDELIERVAWRMAERDGYRYGLGPVDKYTAEILEILSALEAASEQREKGED